MASPSKKSLTDERHDTIVISRSTHNSLLPDELSSRLSNIGSRVRKSVYDGYLTDRYLGTPTTPHPSPAKLPNTSSPSNTFKSANDTVNEIFPRSMPQSIYTPSSSPRKRRRTYVDDSLLTPEGDLTIPSDMMETDEDDVVFDMGLRHDREIKPLRRSSHSSSASFTTLSAASSFSDVF